MRRLKIFDGIRCIDLQRDGKGTGTQSFGRDWYVGVIMPCFSMLALLLRNGGNN